MSEPVWKFEGFVTAAGGRVFEDWYWDDIGDDDRDIISDRMRYLENVERHLWREPRFESLGNIGEITKQTPRGGLRVYGAFTDDHTFVCLHGVLKKVTRDAQGMDRATRRLAKLNSGEGSTHEFDREKRSTRKN